MGYFDALTSSSFKTTSDGQRLFFPWGVFGRGYAIGSEADYQRLQRQVRTFIAISMIAASAGAIAILLVLQDALGRFAVTGAACAVYLALYGVWLRYLRAGLQPSIERLTLRESVTAQARAYSPWLLWLFLVVSLAFVAAGVLVLVLDPREWFAGIAAIVFFGFGGGLFAFMLGVRRRLP